MCGLSVGPRGGEPRQPDQEATPFSSHRKKNAEKDGQTDRPFGHHLFLFFSRRQTGRAGAWAGFDHGAMQTHNKAMAKGDNARVLKNATRVMLMQKARRRPMSSTPGSMATCRPLV